MRVAAAEFVKHKYPIRHCSKEEAIMGVHTRTYKSYAHIHTLLQHGQTSHAPQVFFIIIIIRHTPHMHAHINLHTQTRAHTHTHTKTYTNTNTQTCKLHELTQTQQNPIHKTHLFHTWTVPGKNSVVTGDKTGHKHVETEHQIHARETGSNWTPTASQHQPLVCGKQCSSPLFSHHPHHLL